MNDDARPRKRFGGRSWLILFSPLLVFLVSFAVVFAVEPYAARWPWLYQPFVELTVISITVGWLVSVPAAFWARSRAMGDGGSTPGRRGS
jgi:hypothetical protein